MGFAGFVVLIPLLCPKGECIGVLQANTELDKTNPASGFSDIDLSMLHMMSAALAANNTISEAAQHAARVSEQNSGQSLPTTCVFIV